MSILLDTHAFIWFVLDAPNLPATAKALVEDSVNDVFISPASFWEIAIKVRLGKLDLRCSYDELMQRGIFGNDFIILPIEPKHTSLLTTLPLYHKDPFDRLLVAQAIIDGLAIVSVDAQFDAYGVQRLW